MNLYIYALLDPNTGEVRYIGKSSDPQRRLKSHIQECTNHSRRTNNQRKREWIGSLLANKQKPIVVVLQELSESDDWAFIEFCWGWYYRLRGAILVNNGWDTPITPEQRALIGNRHDITVAPPDLTNFAPRRKAA